METLFTVEHLSIYVGEHALLKDLNLKIPLGKTSMLMGASGSGKSTLLKTMAGLVPPDEGNIRVNGRDYRDMSERESQEFRAWAGFVFQDAALWANQSILDNVAMPLFHHAPYFNRSLARQRAEELIRKLGYKERIDLRPSDLSIGEQKLIGFARAQMMDPPIYFMDGPLDMLDAAGTRRIIALLHELKKQHRTLIIAGDQNDLCCEIADFVYVLQNGKLEQWGELEDLVAAWPESLDKLEGSAWTKLEKRGFKRNIHHEV